MFDGRRNLTGPLEHGDNFVLNVLYRRVCMKLSFAEIPSDTVALSSCRLLDRNTEAVGEK